MGRISIKGGVWTNAEDEILKASVMKYGKNQWARIASLLHKKSAKQCKARWLEWLDPSIKKTEWSKEEDEKLLHMAKLMPTQWRTIAPIVGRTSYQCFERYEYLLDKAQNNLDANIVKTKNELESNPETKPARPDPVDMDEDEIEMLSEARARMANTQGKKAKRKARERQLQDARRLAALQKTRELKAAGIVVKEKHRRGKRVMDYNLEIPFEKKPLKGLRDTSSEVFVPEPYDFNSLRQYDLDTQRKITDKREAQDADKSKKRKELAPLELGKGKELAKRRRLELPAPQVTDLQLEEIVKFGNLAESSRERAISEMNSELTNLLIADGGGTPMMTPRTPMQGGDDSVIREARNILALSNVQTPLAGGVNTPISEIKVQQKSAVQTPNTLLTSRMQESMMGDTPLGNPDEINIDDSSSSKTGVDQSYGRRELMKALQSLPRPQNECELAVGGTMDVEEIKGSVANGDFVEDSEDVEARRVQQAREEAHLRFRMRSQVIQRSLPRPGLINSDILRTEDGLTDLQKAEELVKFEMLVVMHYDNVMNPVGRPSAESEQFLCTHPHKEYTCQEMADAKILLETEMADVKEAMGHGDLGLAEYDRVWVDCLSQIAYQPDESRYTRVSVMDPKERISSSGHALEIFRTGMAKDAKKAGKIESKLQILFGGYQTRARGFMSEIKRLSEEIDATRIELATFERLGEIEKASIPRRIHALGNEVAVQMAREKELQEKYRHLMSEGSTSNGIN